jgi:hypothetical protein
MKPIEPLSVWIGTASPEWIRPLRLFRRQAEGRDNRRVGAVFEAGEGGIDPRHRARGVERPGQDLVQIDCPRQLAEHLVPPSLLLGVLERLRELADHGFHARVHVGHEVGETLVARATPLGAADEPEDDEQKQRNRRRAGGDGYDGSRRHSDHFFHLIRPPTIPGPPPEQQPKRARSHCNRRNPA